MTGNNPLSCTQVRTNIKTLKSKKLRCERRHVSLWLSSSCSLHKYNKIILQAQITANTYLPVGMGRVSKYKRLQSVVATTAATDAAAGVGKEGHDGEKPSDWVVNINLLLQKGLVYDSGKKWTIYRVPTNLLKIHKKAFVPKIISIGPFHYRDPRLKVMDEHKERYLFRLLGGRLSKWTSEKQVSRPPVDGAGSENNPAGIKLEDLESAMRGLELKTRETYAEAVTMSSESFVEMMVLDGCFIVELLRLFHKSSKNKTDDAIFTTRWMLRTLQRDLLMLENQLPFFVLEALFGLTSPEEQQERPSLIELTLEFFNPLLPRNCLETKFKDEPEHLLDVFLQSFLSPMQQKIEEPEWTFLRQHRKRSSNAARDEQEKQLIHCVAELQEAGIKFKRKEMHQLLDINFSRGVLEIPPLYINDNTVPIFLNFLAYEQCDQEAEPYFTNFFMFFDGLINSSKDVKILHQYEIINHSLGSMENVAKLFNNVCREIVCDLDHCYLSKQMAEANEFWKAYYATKWHIWWTNLINEYFSSPWTAISLVAAIFLLILTALQTAYTALPYYYSSN
uniref:Uncharacterized protein n=1 Tax=Kalanchoe fedtschenkoi TaxID=63787 RepID=A0A7N0RCB3_KALFE